MKAWKIAIAGACGAFGGLSATSAMAQANQTFQLAFCNISAFSDVYVAITSKGDAQRWNVSGWYPIPDSGSFRAEPESTRCLHAHSCRHVRPPACQWGCAPE